MSRTFLLAALAAALLSCASAARITPLEDVQRMMSVSADNIIQNPVQALMDALNHHKGDDRAYLTVRYFVPPSETSDFEDKWLRLKDKAEKDHGKALEVFTLKQAKLTNVLYYEYSEWNDPREVKEHYKSKHVEKFVDWVNDHGIKWTIEVLMSESDDIEEESRKGKGEEDTDDLQALFSTTARLERKKKEKKSDKKDKEADQGDQHADDWDDFIPEEYRHFVPKNVRPKHKKDNKGHKMVGTHKGGEEHAHVLIAYFVPPGEGEGFIDAWTKTAEDTIKEDGNMVYSLRKVATDNTRFYGYGTWDSLDSYMDHFDSKHLGHLLDYTADKDITWVIIPLEEIGGDEE